MAFRMPFDDVAWARTDGIYDAWKEELLKEENMRTVGVFIAKHRGGVPTVLHQPRGGSFNVAIQMEFLDGGSAIIRFPIPGRSVFREEKVRLEVATMRLLADKTTIPVPFILHWGMADESPCNFGPFIIMEYVQHVDDIVWALNQPGLGRDDRPMLDPNVPEDRLEFVYGQMAEILLQLSKVELPRIGSLVSVDDGEGDETWLVDHRPLTFNMNQLLTLGNYPKRQLPSGTFDTSASYADALADVHLTHLVTQRNDAIVSADDCRQRYLGRYLFKKLAKEGRLLDHRSDCAEATEAESFPLYCDDLRPANVLLNAKYEIVAVIDWEFSYAAPAIFTDSPPWWLLLERPEYWPGGLIDWANTYEPRLHTFLRVLEEKEREAAQRQTDRGMDPTPGAPLSARMRTSWADGSFWVSYALRHSWAFDQVFWTFLVHRFFGPGETSAWEDRLALLSEEARDALEVLVRKKLKDGQSRALVDWADSDYKPFKDEVPAMYP